MFKKTIWRLVIFLMSMICYLAAFLYFESHHSNLASDADIGIPGQFHIIISYAAISALVSFLLQRHRILVAVLLVPRFIGIYFIGLMMGEQLVIEYLLTTAAILELTLYVAFPRFLLVSSGMVVLFTLAQTQFTIITFSSRPSSVAALLYAAYALLLVLLLSRSELAMLRNAELTARIVQLDLATKNLTRANIGFQEETLHIKNRTEFEERLRISREIHDTIGYAFVSIMTLMESATDFAKFDSDKTQELLKKARDLANSALEEIRSALSSLRNLDNPKSTGVREVSELTKTFANATGVEIKMEYGNVPWIFGSDVDHAIYHCIQEGMVNSFYHGKATKIDIRFWISNGEIHIYIRDNGTGAKDIAEGIGIKGMKERVAFLGGRISYYSNDGFEVRLAIPVGER